MVARFVKTEIKFQTSTKIIAKNKIILLALEIVAQIKRYVVVTEIAFDGVFVHHFVKFLK